MVGKTNIGYFHNTKLESVSNEILNDFVVKLANIDNELHPTKTINKDSVLKDFEKFEELVLANPKMKMMFSELQKKFAEDPEYAAKVDPNFVAGVMLLNISE